MKILAYFAFGVLFAVSSGFGGEDSPGGPKFKGRVIEADSVGIAKGFSSDGQAVTLLFDNLQSEVWAKGGALVKTRTLSIDLPIEPKDQEVNLSQDIRGYVSVDEGARAVLVVQSAGETHVIDLQKAKAEGKTRSTDGDSIKEAMQRAAEEAKGFEKEDEPQGSFDFYHRINSKLRPGASYRITFFLLVERDLSTAEMDAHLVVDSLDIEIGPVKKSKRKS